MDIDALVAIDVHTHAEVSRDGRESLPAELMAASARLFQVAGSRKPTVPEIAEYYRQRNMVAVADEVLFGSDFPVLTPDRWLADLEKVDIRPEVRPRLLKDNAARLLGLDAGRGAVPRMVGATDPDGREGHDA